MADEKTNENPQGFYFNQAACVGCRTCQMACKDKNDLNVGLLLRRVTSYEVGEFPNPGTYHYSGACNHCQAPACVEVCPAGATYINAEDGTIQHDATKCIGCGYCVSACPYGHPSIDEELNIARRCDACIELRATGEQPACVSACPMRALEFGPIEELRAAHLDAVAQIVVLPDSATTNPSIAIDVKTIALEGKPMLMTL